MLGAAARQLRTWGADWSRRRQGEDGRHVTLKRRRVYILPTRFGVAFACLVLAMLLGSLNYGASLGFALTFLLGGLGLVIMHHCHNNLLGTMVRFAGAAPVFAGATAQFRLSLHNEARAPRYDITLGRDRDRTASTDLAPGQSRTLTLHVPAPARGYLVLGRFGISTGYPGNLFHAWSWLHMQARCLVYPRPAPPGRPMPVGGGPHGSHGIRSSDDADFVGLRAASPGDPPRRLAWKAFARTDQLMAKQFSGASAEPCLFAWHELDDLDREGRLSQLARWCLDAADEMRSFGLVLPGRVIPLGSGDRHLHECLSALALFEG
jgi:uncharacterized protein (DUF58 family)